MHITSARLALPLLAVLAVASLAAESDRSVIEIEKGGEYTVTAGQTVHFIFRYDGFAGQIITNLEVTIDGKPVKDPKIESRLDPKQVEVGQVLFIYEATKAGTYQIKVTPLAGTAKRKPREHTVKVLEK